MWHCLSLRVSDFPGQVSQVSRWRIDSVQAVLVHRCQSRPKKDRLKRNFVFSFGSWRGVWGLKMMEEKEFFMILTLKISEEFPVWLVTSSLKEVETTSKLLGIVTYQPNWSSMICLWKKFGYGLVLGRKNFNNLIGFLKVCIYIWREIEWNHAIFVGKKCRQLLRPCVFSGFRQMSIRGDGFGILGCEPPPSMPVTTRISWHF